MCLTLYLRTLFCILVLVALAHADIAKHHKHHKNGRTKNEHGNQLKLHGHDGMASKPLKHKFKFPVGLMKKPRKITSRPGSKDKQQSTHVSLKSQEIVPHAAKAFKERHQGLKKKAKRNQKTTTTEGKINISLKKAMQKRKQFNNKHHKKKYTKKLLKKTSRHLPNHAKHSVAASRHHQDDKVKQKKSTKLKALKKQIRIVDKKTEKVFSNKVALIFKLVESFGKHYLKPEIHFALCNAYRENIHCHKKKEGRNQFDDGSRKFKNDIPDGSVILYPDNYQSPITKKNLIVHRRPVKPLEIDLLKEQTTLLPEYLVIQERSDIPTVKEREKHVDEIMNKIRTAVRGVRKLNDQSLPFGGFTKEELVVLKENLRKIAKHEDISRAIVLSDIVSPKEEVNGTSELHYSGSSNTTSVKNKPTSDNNQEMDQTENEIFPISSNNDKRGLSNYDSLGDQTENLSTKREILSDLLNPNFVFKDDFNIPHLEELMLTPDTFEDSELKAIAAVSESPRRFKEKLSPAKENFASTTENDLSQPITVDGKEEQRAAPTSLATTEDGEVVLQNITKTIPNKLTNSTRKDMLDHNNKTSNNSNNNNNNNNMNYTLKENNQEKVLLSETEHAPEATRKLEDSQSKTKQEEGKDFLASNMTDNDLSNASSNVEENDTGATPKNASVTAYRNAIYRVLHPQQVGGQKYHRSLSVDEKFHRLDMVNSKKHQKKHLVTTAGNSSQVGKKLTGDSKAREKDVSSTDSRMNKLSEIKPEHEETVRSGEKESKLEQKPKDSDFLEEEKTARDTKGAGGNASNTSESQMEKLSEIKELQKDASLRINTTNQVQKLREMVNSITVKIAEGCKEGISADCLQEQQQLLSKFSAEKRNNIKHKSSNNNTTTSLNRVKMVSLDGTKSFVVSLGNSTHAFFTKDGSLASSQTQSAAVHPQRRTLLQTQNLNTAMLYPVASLRKRSKRELKMIEFKLHNPSTETRSFNKNNIKRKEKAIQQKKKTSANRAQKKNDIMSEEQSPNTRFDDRYGETWFGLKNEIETIRDMEKGRIQSGFGVPYVRNSLLSSPGGSVDTDPARASTSSLFNKICARADCRDEIDPVIERQPETTTVTKNNNYSPPRTHQQREKTEIKSEANFINIDINKMGPESIPENGDSNDEKEMAMANLDSKMKVEDSDNDEDNDSNSSALKTPDNGNAVLPLVTRNADGDPSYQEGVLLSEEEDKTNEANLIQKVLMKLSEENEEVGKISSV